MKRVFGSIFWVVPLYLWGQNVVFNPGFDMTPWDTGWTIEIDTNSQPSCSIQVHGICEAGAGMSHPNCCSLYTYVAYNCGSTHARIEGNARVVISQFFSEIVSPQIKTYVKYHLIQCATFPTSSCSIQVYINNIGWKTIWERTPEYYDIDTIWTEVCTTLTDTISGIRFIGGSRYYDPSATSSRTTWGYFWIDDVYVGESGSEEKGGGAESKELKVWPNPFIEFAKVKNKKLEFRMQIYDISGKLVKETENRIIGRDLLGGIYFVKVKGYEPLKIVKIGGAR